MERNTELSIGVVAITRRGLEMRWWVEGRQKERNSYGFAGNENCRQGKTPWGRGFVNLVKLRMGVGVEVGTSLFFPAPTWICSLFRRCVVTVFEEMDSSDFMSDSLEIDGTKHKETGERIPSLSLDWKLYVDSSLYTINRSEQIEQCQRSGGNA